MSQRFQSPPGIAPGQWSGSHAAGIGDKERGAIAIDPVQRVGEKTAKEYPWIASILSRMPCTPATILGAGGIAPAGTTMRFTRPGGEQSFYNNTNRPIKIDEIRVYAMTCPLFPPFPIVSTLNLQIARQVGIRMWTNKKEYVRDYLPLWQFQTESNRVAEAWRFRGLFNFPADYYLDRGNAFQLRTRIMYGMNPLLCADTVPLPPNPIFRSSNLDFAFGLQGEYVGTKYPAKLMRQVVLPTAGATPVNPLFSTIPFNEGRDSPINDVEIHSLGVGMRDILSSAVAGMPNALANPFLAWVQCQFVPPQGPKWMGTEDWIPIPGLVDQPGPVIQGTDAGVAGNGGPWDNSMIIHRPVTPYVLQPREELSIELRALFPLNYSMAFFSATPGPSAAGTWDDTLLGVPIWCTMYGRQESLA
jgi:hypothetical protein